MEWETKMGISSNNNSWDLAAELETPPNSLNCSVDLKLGGFCDFALSSNNFRDFKDYPQFKTSNPPMGQLVGSTHQSLTVVPGQPSKRQRGGMNGGHNGNNNSVSYCLVEGCKADLNECREYHRRHKVCEIHSKTPVVIVGGKEQRFCQQCSRFHLLAEFDEVKRSCRKRLDGHNRRRRKPQPDPLHSVAGGFFVNDHHGARFHSYPQILPAPEPLISQPKWPVIPRNDHSTLTHPPSHFPNQTTTTKQRREIETHFPLLQHTNYFNLSSTNLDAPILTAQESSSGLTNSGLTQPQAVPLESDCALSLLSSPHTLSQLGQTQIPMGQPLVSQLQLQLNQSLAQASEATAAAVSLTGFQYNAGLYGVGTGEGSTSHGDTHALPFIWH